MNGLQALDAAGFTLTGTQRQGLAFVCRINGRPAADEKLATDGNPDYTEQCVDTPPPDAYWAYWYADRRRPVEVLDVRARARTKRSRAGTKAGGSS